MLVQELPATLISYNYPGALDTRFTGINDNNRIAGFYADRNSVHHGFSRNPRKA